MVISLTTMTAQASSSITGDELIMGENYVNYDGDECYDYIWTPEESGTVTFTFAESEIGWTCVVYEGLNFVNASNSMDNSTGVFTFSVEAGKEYTISIDNPSYTAGVIAFTAEMGEGSGASTAGSTLETAIDLTANNTINIAANGKTYYTVAMLDNSKTYNVTVTNSTVGPMAGQQQIGITAYYNGAADGDTVYNVVESTAVVRPGMTGAIYFSVENAFMYGDLNATVTVAEVTGGGSEGEGGNTPSSTVGTYDDPAEISFNSDNTVVVEQWNAYWYEYTATEDGRILITVDGNTTGWYFDVYNGEEYLYCVTSGTDDVIVKAGETIKLGFGHETGNATFDFEAVFEAGSYEKTPNGTENYPFTMPMGTNTVNVPAGEPVWYKYVATESGTLVLTMKTDESTNGWFYDGYLNEFDSSAFPANPETGFGNASTDTEPASLKSISLNAGDVVKFMVMTALNADWERPAGTVVFNAWFTAGEGTGSDEKAEKVVSDTLLVLGKNTVELDPSAETTIFEFTPEEAGEYIFTTDNGVLGYWGGGSFFTQDLTENKTTTLKYNLENVGPSIMIGVTGAEGDAVITIKKGGEAETKPTIPTIIYENVIVPTWSEEYEVDLPNIVNIEDNVVDKAVLGTDGYYHLNEANGPILFVDFDSDKMSFIEAYGYGRLNGVVKNDANETVAIVDYNEAFMSYYSAANDNGCYPLTEDLITILKEVGANETWYGEFGWIGGDPDEAWMFACCYADAITTVDSEVEKAEIEDTNIIIKDSNKITADSLEAIIEASKGNDVVFTVETGDKVVTYTFAADTLKLVDGKETYDFTVEIIDDYAKATEDKAVIEKDMFVARVNFNYEGKLPAKATIIIPVGTDYASKTLYYYKILADGTLKYVCDATVDAKGNASVTQDSCSDYVLLTKKLGNATTGGSTTGTTSPSTGDNANVAVWAVVMVVAAGAAFVVAESKRRAR